MKSNGKRLHKTLFGLVIGLTTLAADSEICNGLKPCLEDSSSQSCTVGEKCSAVTYSAPCSSCVESTRLDQACFVTGFYTVTITLWQNGNCVILPGHTTPTCVDSDVSEPSDNTCENLVSNCLPNS